MKADKSLEEVWAWKDQVHKILGPLSWPDRLKRIEEEAQKIVSSHHVTLKELSSHPKP